MSTPNWKKPSQQKLKLRLKEIKGWGILTLMQNMKDAYLRELSKERDTIRTFQTQPYKDSPLENLDKIEAEFNKKFDGEFKKLFDQAEKEFVEKGGSIKFPAPTKPEKNSA